MKPTPGPVSITDLTKTLVRTEDGKTLYDGSDYEPVWEVAKENAVLIAEAFNVHHETGLTPRELKEQRDELSSDFILQALNAYWNDANTNLLRRDLGDIERQNYEHQLRKSKEVMNTIAKAKSL